MRGDLHGRRCVRATWPTTGARRWGWDASLARTGAVVQREEGMREASYWNIKAGGGGREMGSREG